MRTLVLLLCLCFLCPGSLAAKRPPQPKTISTPVPVMMQHPVLTGKVNLVWQHKNLPAVDVSNLPRIEGLNVVSPCWYDIENETGLLKDKTAPAGYATQAHARGYQVWPLITSSFDPQMFHKVLDNAAARRFFIEQLLAEAGKHQVDGFNLDFENIRDDDKDKLTGFVKEISKALREQHLVLSMDVTIPSGASFWSKCYDHQALGQEVDYLLLMAYDQHTPSQHVAGPTAALDWVERGLQRTLKLVPARKVVLGMPLYMRLWSQDLATGKVNGKTLSMPEAEKTTVKASILPSWQAEYNDQQALLKCSYEEGGQRFTYWLEDANSIRRKAALIKKYDLAGAAAWRKGFETADVWPVLEAAVK